MGFKIRESSNNSTTIKTKERKYVEKISYPITNTIQNRIIEIPKEKETKIRQIESD